MSHVTNDYDLSLDGEDIHALDIFTHEQIFMMKILWTDSTNFMHLTFITFKAYHLNIL